MLLLSISFCTKRYTEHGYDKNIYLHNLLLSSFLSTNKSERQIIFYQSNNSLFYNILIHFFNTPTRILYLFFASTSSFFLLLNMIDQRIYIHAYNPTKSYGVLPNSLLLLYKHFFFRYFLFKHF